MESVLTTWVTAENHAKRPMNANKIQPVINVLTEFAEPLAVQPALTLHNATFQDQVVIFVWLEYVHKEVVEPLALFKLTVLEMATAPFVQRDLDVLHSVEDLAL